MPDCFVGVPQEERPCPYAVLAMELNKTSGWNYTGSSSGTISGADLKIDGVPEFSDTSLMLRNSDVTITRNEFRGGNVGGITISISVFITHMLLMVPQQEYTILELPLGKVTAKRDTTELTLRIVLDS